MAFYSVDEAASGFARLRGRMIEEQLVLTIEELLGRVPSNQEVAHHSLRVLSSSKLEYEDFYWKDTFLFGVFTNVYPMKCYCYFDGPVLKRETQ